MKERKLLKKKKSAEFSYSRLAMRQSGLFFLFQQFPNLVTYPRRIKRSRKQTRLSCVALLAISLIANHFLFPRSFVFVSIFFELFYSLLILPETLQYAFEPRFRVSFLLYHGLVQQRRRASSDHCILPYPKV